MRFLKGWLTLGFILGVIFVGIGDTFLPKPLSTFSKNTRIKINQILMGFTPDPKVKNPNENLSNQMEAAEERAKGKGGNLIED